MQPDTIGRSMPGLTIQNTELPSGWQCIAVAGEIDLATVPELERAIDSALLSDSLPLVIDLTESSFMDSTGLRALVMAKRRFDEEGRSFAIAVSRGPVSRLIGLSGVESTIRIVDNTEDLEAHTRET
jgi:anti-sigma B factor antagonist